MKNGRPDRGRPHLRQARYPLWESADRAGTTVQQRSIHDGIDGRVQALLTDLGVSVELRQPRPVLATTTLQDSSKPEAPTGSNAAPHGLES
jgi:hypothetical protein